MNENTPTDDEREAPKQELCDRCGWAISGHVRSQYGLDCPPGASRPGFRRSEVSEPPSSENAYTGIPLSEVLRSEPQGEPSDAQVIAALNAWGDDQTATLGDWHPEKVQAMRAALRAAGVAK